MSYLFENLDDKSFQLLCQSILTTVYPDIQCLPVGQPDGGRDAILYSSDSNLSSKDFAVFQVKFSLNPSSKDEREVVDSIVSTELQKIKKLIAAGAKKYYLLTNVTGTSHLGAGSIDRVHAKLTEKLGIESICWWRDDLSRRIDGNSSLKWSFPNILRAQDMLEFLLLNKHNPNSREHAEILRSYMTHQLRKDSQLKFKQIDLDKNILDLFVDVPARFVAPQEPQEFEKWSRRLARSEGLYELVHEPPHRRMDSAQSESSLSRAPGAGHLLGRSDTAHQFPQIVLEGAPGQGKSTVTQFLCQLHRMTLLKRRHELNQVNERLRPSEARIPFRIDLRDYASWILGKDPFSEDPDALLPSGTNPILEAFIAAQVKRLTAHDFTVLSLMAVSKYSQILIVLDGFDEVADVTLRDRLIDEINDASARLGANALSVQIIVTSRPAAFATSKVFSQEEWQHVQLLSLSYATINEYAKKWLNGRDSDARDRREITLVLREKLKQSHVRDLARNPMQLAILLALIAIQGASLPDKRTSLYDKYMDVFFNRESEKSAIVRDNREILIRIHRFIAYMLQANAEEKREAGSISETRLKEIVRDYLKQAERDYVFVDDLFTGLRERVGALVSRVQGTFEFEVQPLREYFAARYLYDTAPYSPSGHHRRGALPDRFGAIARNPYWLNVTRFYAGCYSSGELASLVDGLEEIHAEEKYNLTSFIRELATVLLRDYVLDHNRRLAARLVKNVVLDQRFEIFAARRGVGNTEIDTILPAGSGQELLIERCKKDIIGTSHSDRIQAYANILMGHISSDEAFKFWMDLPSKASSRDLWIFTARAFSLVSFITHDQFLNLFKEDPLIFIRDAARYGRVDLCHVVPNGYRILLSSIFSGHINLAYYVTHKNVDIPLTILSIVSMLQSQGFETRFGKNDQSSIYGLLQRRRPGRQWTDANIPEILNNDGTMNNFGANFSQSLHRLLSSTVNESFTNSNRWDDYFVQAEALTEERWGLCILANNVARLITSYSDEGPLIEDIKSDILSFAFAAKKFSGKLDWWKLQVADPIITTQSFIGIFLLSSVEFMSQRVLFEMSSYLSVLVDQLSDNDWQILSSLVRDRYDSHGNRAGRWIDFQSQSSPEKLSPRLVVLLMRRIGIKSGNILFDRYLSDYDGIDSIVVKDQIDFDDERQAANRNFWCDRLPVIARAYSINVVPDIVMMLAHSADDRLDLIQAQEICTNSHIYPLALVGYAENVLSKGLSLSKKTVSFIASEEDWCFEG